MEKHTRNKNEFLDINTMPNQPGIILFPISISRISNAQNAQRCFTYMEQFIPKIRSPLVGLNVIYTDNLYLYSDEKAKILKNKFQSLINSHKFEFLKLVRKNLKYIPDSFSFSSWSQILLESKEFLTHLGELKKIFENDEDFKKMVIKDIKLSGKEISENNINFILEEILLFYLIIKGKIRLVNDYVHDTQEWILYCYPGKPLLSEIYLHQKNFFKYKNKKNIYENSYYDLEVKKRYDYDTIDLETFI